MYLHQCQRRCKTPGICHHKAFADGLWFSIFSRCSDSSAMRWYNSDFSSGLALASCAEYFSSIDSDANAFWPFSNRQKPSSTMLLFMVGFSIPRQIFGHMGEKFVPPAAFIEQDFLPELFWRGFKDKLN